MLPSKKATNKETNQLLDVIKHELRPTDANLKQAKKNGLFL